MTNEVKPSEWENVCKRVQEAARGSLVRIESINTEGSTRMLKDPAPLRSLTWDGTTDRCNNKMVIETGRADERGERHEIVEPIHIKFRDGNGQGTFRSMEISAENGGVIVEFRPPLAASVVVTE